MRPWIRQVLRYNGHHMVDGGLGITIISRNNSNTITRDITDGMWLFLNALCERRPPTLWACIPCSHILSHIISPFSTLAKLFQLFIQVPISIEVVSKVSSFSSYDNPHYPQITLIKSLEYFCCLGKLLSLDLASFSYLTCPLTW